MDAYSTDTDSLSQHLSSHHPLIFLPSSFSTYSSQYPGLLLWSILLVYSSGLAIRSGCRTPGPHLLLVSLVLRSWARQIRLSAPSSIHQGAVSLLLYCTSYFASTKTPTKTPTKTVRSLARPIHLCDPPCGLLACPYRPFQAHTLATLPHTVVDAPMALPGPLIMADERSHPALDTPSIRAHTVLISTRGGLPTTTHRLVTKLHGAGYARPYGGGCEVLCPSAASPTRCKFGSGNQLSRSSHSRAYIPAVVPVIVMVM